MPELCELAAREGGHVHWGVYSLGYNTSMMPDLRGVWAGNPDLARLSEYLRTTLSLDPMDRYANVALTAHSMGGLVAQRALVDDEDLAVRTTHLTMFGTPSGGMHKAGWFRLFNTQARDMDKDGEFIRDLRSRWSDGFRDQLPFELTVAAGDRDEFVPATSSLGPFSDEHRAVVPGNHVQIVAPEDDSSLSFKLLRSVLGGSGIIAGPFDSAAIAVELGEFQSAVAQLEPHADELDDQHLVQLAMALDGVDRSADALAVLEARPTLGTDATGVLAGRLKRRWMAEGRDADGARALNMYSEALERALSNDDSPQAFYHAINAAFMTWAYGQGEAAALELADTALTHARQTPGAPWSAATEGEALLYIRDGVAALAAYSRGLAGDHTPREVRSMYQQAAWASQLVGDAELSDGGR